jgi:hypothetical protein
MEWTFPWAIQRMWVIQKQGVMVWPCILVVVNIERFAPCKDGLCPFRSHYVVLTATIQFLIFVLFLVQIVWRKFKWGFGDIATSFRWRPKYTLNLSLFQLCFPCLSFHVRFNYLFLFYILFNVYTFWGNFNYSFIFVVDFGLCLKTTQRHLQF